MENNDMFLVTCTVCGYKFGKSKSGTFTESKCSKCGSMIRYSIDGNTVTTKLVERSEKQKKNKAG